MVHVFVPYRTVRIARQIHSVTDNPHSDPEGGARGSATLFATSKKIRRRRRYMIDVYISQPVFQLRKDINKTA